MGLLRWSYLFRTTQDPPSLLMKRMLMQRKDLVYRFQEDDSDADHRWNESADNQLEFHTFVSSPGCWLGLPRQTPGNLECTRFFKIDSSFFIFDPSCFIFQSSFSYLSWSRPERWIVTIPSSYQWLATIGNHWKTITTNGFGDQKPSKNHC